MKLPKIKTYPEYDLGFLLNLIIIIAFNIVFQCSFLQKM